MRRAGLEGPALVPTMGALHEGHLSLIRAAHRTGNPVVVSIFVNPTQFGPSEDYVRYPKNLDRDVALATTAGADFIFHPDVAEIYPRPSTTITVPEATELYEGRVRPHHFQGVATVVCKLFQIVRPRLAFFGLKDLQQCAVIRRMVEDLDIDVELRFEPIVREPDGLAMSSRNVYLSPSDRLKAPLIHERLIEGKSRLLAGESMETVLEQARDSLGHAGFIVDYYDLIDTTTFKPTRQLDVNSALIVAAKLGNTRLIDNLLLFDGSNMP